MNNVNEEDESNVESEREDPEEGRRAVIRRVECRPEQSEVDEHNVSHIPFRSWCAHCVRGKAVNRGHSRRQVASEVPIVSIDYAYVNEDGEKRKERKEREKRGEEGVDGESRGMPMIVIHDSMSKYVASEIVPEKGLNEYAVRRLAQIINRFGYRRIIIKSDQEPSIVALK
jgi:glutaredoxin